MDKTLSINSLFPPYCASYTLYSDNPQVEKDLQKKKINMAQEIISRFGLFYPSLLGEPLAQQLEKLTPNSDSAKLNERVALVLKKYTLLIEQGGNYLTSLLSSQSALSGKKPEEVIDQQFSLLKYLPMPIEQLNVILLTSPLKSWADALKERLENFKKTLIQQINEESSQLFNLQIVSDSFDCSQIPRLQQFVLSKAAFPLDENTYVPFIDALAEWIAYLSETANTASLTVAYKDVKLSRIDLSCEFILKRAASFFLEVKKRAETNRYAQKLSFHSYLARRSFYIFCEKLNLSFSDAYCQTLILHFENNEDLRRALVFFSCSLKLQKTVLLDTTPPSLFDPCFCLSNIKNWLLRSSEPSSISISSDTLQKTLSLLFEWLLESSPTDLREFNKFYQTCAYQDLLESLEKLQKLNNAWLSSNKMLIVLMFVIKNHDSFQKALTFIDQLMIDAFFKKALKIMFLKSIYDQKTEDFFKNQDSFTSLQLELETNLTECSIDDFRRKFHIVFFYCVKASSDDQQSFFATPSYDLNTLLAKLDTMDTLDIKLEDRLAALISESAHLPKGSSSLPPDSPSHDLSFQTLDEFADVPRNPPSLPTDNLDHLSFQPVDIAALTDKQPPQSIDLKNPEDIFSQLENLILKQSGNESSETSDLSSITPIIDLEELLYVRKWITSASERDRKAFLDVLQSTPFAIILSTLDSMKTYTIHGATLDIFNQKCQDAKTN